MNLAIYPFLMFIFFISRSAHRKPPCKFLSVVDEKLAKIFCKTKYNVKWACNSRIGFKRRDRLFRVDPSHIDEERLISIQEVIPKRITTGRFLYVVSDAVGHIIARQSV